MSQGPSLPLTAASSQQIQLDGVKVPAWMSPMNG